MDTLDKILKNQKGYTPENWKPEKGQCEVVLLKKYPHGYDTFHRQICDSMDGALHIALGHPEHFKDDSIQWRIYNSQSVAVAQSPKLHLCFPSDMGEAIKQLEDKLLTKENELFAVTTDRDEWKLSTVIANKAAKQNDQSYKDAFRYRQIINAIADAANMAEVNKILIEHGVENGIKDKD